MPPHKVEESQGKGLDRYQARNNKQERALKAREKGCTKKVVTGEDRNVHLHKRRRESWLHGS